MKFLIIFVLTLATGFGLPGKEIKSHKNVIDAGRREKRMTRSRDASQGQFPYQVYIEALIYDRLIAVCNGILISHTDIVTAAHCVEDMVRVKVILGSIRRKFGDYTYDIKTENITIHPDYNLSKFANDIAMIKIPYTEYSANIMPAELPDRYMINSSYVDQNATASDWGRSKHGRFSPFLQYTNYAVITNNNCSSYFNQTILPSQICAVNYHQSSNCDRNTGGPLVLTNTSTLIGIASFIRPYTCGTSRPNVFTRITSFLDWIKINSDLNLIN